MERNDLLSSIFEMLRANEIAVEDIPPVQDAKHYIVLGRASDNTAAALVHRFGRENIIQSRYGTHGDGEATFELFLDGKLDDHPLEQNFSQEKKQEIREKLEGSHVTIVHSVSGENTSSRALSLIQSLETLKEDYKVGSITLVVPHMGLTRADRKFFKKLKEAGVTINIKQDNARANAIMAKLVRLSGADRIVGMDFHSNSSKNDYRNVFNTNFKISYGMEMIVEGLAQAGKRLKDQTQLFKMVKTAHRNLINRSPRFPGDGAVFTSTNSILVSHLKTIFNSQAEIFSIRIGAPDGANKPKDSGMQRAREASEALIGYHDEAAMFKIAKERISSTKTRVIPEQSSAEVEGKICVLVDDIISSGSTQLQAARYLREKGASKIIAYAAHGVLINDSLRHLLEDEVIDEYWVTDTVPGVVEKWERLKQELAQEVQDGKLDGEKYTRMITKFTILPIANAVVDLVAKDHGSRMKTCPTLAWANDNPSNGHSKFPEMAA